MATEMQGLGESAEGGDIASYPEFPKALNGYERSAVDAWVRAVVDELRVVRDDRDWARRQIALLQSQVSAAKVASAIGPGSDTHRLLVELVGDQRLRSATEFLVRAEQLASDILREASSEAEARLASAVSRAESMEREAERRCQEVRDQRFAELDSLLRQRRVEADELLATVSVTRGEFDAWQEGVLTWLESCKTALAQLSPPPQPAVAVNPIAVHGSLGGVTGPDYEEPLAEGEPDEPGREQPTAPSWIESGIGGDERASGFALGAPTSALENEMSAAGAPSSKAQAPPPPPPAPHPSQAAPGALSVVGGDPDAPLPPPGYSLTGVDSEAVS